MKKQLLLLLLFFSLATSNAFSQTVYITKTGKKYHEATCRYLSRSSIAINFSDARAEGYTPCSICDPPVKVTGKKSQQVYTITAVAAQRAVDVQCSAKTKSGARCKRCLKALLVCAGSTGRLSKRTQLIIIPKWVIRFGTFSF